MKLIDTHAHIYSKEFHQDLNDVIENARQKGIEKILLPNIDSSSVELMHQVAKQFSSYCIPMIGLHPTSVKENFKEELKICKSWLESEKYCAIGEIGIDLYWDTHFLKEQQKAFDIQVNWALEYELPVSIHSRNSFSEIIEVLKAYENTNLTGVFHSFSGNLEQAFKIAEMGFLLGINGIVSFKNSDLESILPQISMNQLVLETDAPYLAPAPKRGTRNEPSFLLYVAQKIAEIYQIEVEEVARITSHNAKEMFQL